MDVSVLACKNHQSTNMEEYELQALVYSISHHSPDKFCH